MGYAVLEVIISVLIIDLVILEINRVINQQKIDNGVKEGIANRMGNIEKLCSHIVYKLETFPNYEIHSIENRIVKHKTELKEEFKDSLERIAKKAIEIENKLMQMRRTLAAAVASFDERLKSIETIPEEITEEEIFK